MLATRNSDAAQAESHARKRAVELDDLATDVIEWYSIKIRYYLPSRVSRAFYARANRTLRTSCSAVEGIDVRNNIAFILY